ncbi:MAG: hypothetical protein AVDCRST_MAG90-1368 [uncultured Microvirga sp.]|uniref:Uncharacterized protein n=1 Tax=uncultured Microvirga sp. TaxID=412392 RepID=A0A6J4L9Q9_9HYPH|nr:MAG: hypothetical protein AVDCRST_MAG90-1368 [uncultured Microvirga sp.]
MTVSLRSRSRPLRAASSAQGRSGVIAARRVQPGDSSEDTDNIPRR